MKVSGYFVLSFLTWKKQRRPEVWALPTRIKSRISVMSEYPPPTPETHISAKFGGKHWVTRGGSWVACALIDACSKNSEVLILDRAICLMTRLEKAIQIRESFLMGQGWYALWWLEKGIESTEEGTLSLYGDWMHDLDLISTKLKQLKFSRGCRWKW